MNYWKTTFDDVLLPWALLRPPSWTILYWPRNWEIFILYIFMYHVFSIVKWSFNHSFIFPRLKYRNLMFIASRERMAVYNKGYDLSRNCRYRYILIILIYVIIYRLIAKHIYCPLLSYYIFSSTLQASCILYAYCPLLFYYVSISSTLLLYIFLYSPTVYCPLLSFYILSSTLLLYIVLYSPTVYCLLLFYWRLSSTVLLREYSTCRLITTSSS